MLIITLLFLLFASGFIHLTLQISCVVLSVCIAVVMLNEIESNHNTLNRIGNGPILWVCVFVALQIMSSYFTPFEFEGSVTSAIIWAQGLYLSLILFTSVSGHDEVKRLYWMLICVVGMLLILGQVAKIYPQFMSNDYLQFSYAIDGSHNHFGDLAGLLIVVSAILSGLSPVYFFPAVCVALPTLLSYSRSAYISILSVLTLLIFQSRKKILLLSFTFVFVLLTSVISLISISGLQKIHEINALRIVSNTLLKTPLPLKHLSGRRVVYLEQAIKGITERPIIGYGASAFGYISNIHKQYADEYSSSTHNIVSEALIEGGFLFVLPYVGFMLFALYRGIKRRNMYVFVALYLFVLFQFDYIYKSIPLNILFHGSLWLLINDGKKKESNPPAPSSLSILLYFLGAFFVLFGLYMMTTQMFVRVNRPDIALCLYPHSTEAQAQLISTLSPSPSNDTVVARFNTSDRLVAMPVLNESLRYYERAEDKRNELRILSLMYKQNPTGSFELVKRLFMLHKKVYGESNSSQFFAEALNQYKQHLRSWQYRALMKSEIESFCTKNSIVGCTTQ